MEEPKFDQAPIPESPNPESPNPESPDAESPDAEQKLQKIWPNDYTSEEIKERLRKRKPYQMMEFGIDPIPTPREERKETEEDVQRRLKNRKSGASINFGTDPIPDPSQQRKWPEDFPAEVVENVRKRAIANRERILGPEIDYDNSSVVQQIRERSEREDREFEERLQIAKKQYAQNLESIRKKISEIPEAADTSSPSEIDSAK